MPDIPARAVYVAKIHQARCTLCDSAKAVYVAKIHQARCTLCDWSGELLASYQEANTERVAHLKEHRNA